MFRRTIGVFFRHDIKAVLVAVCLALCARAAAAQAFLPPAGEGNVTASYQDTLARGELDRNGQPYWEEGTTRAHALNWEVEWGLTDRVALNVTFPVITARYRGDHPHPVSHLGEPKPIDDGTYHGSVQDLHFGLRYGLKTGALAVAPFAEGIIPSHHYESLGHSAIGTDLRALRMGVNVGGFLDPVASGLYFQTQLAYAVVQEVVGIRPNRSSLDSEVGYFVTPRLAVRFLEGLVITHDGLRFPEPRFLIPVFFLNHDRLKRRNFLNLGGGGSFAFTDSLEGFVAVVTTVWGENVHPVHGVTVGMNWHLRAHGGSVVPSRDSGRRLGAVAPVPHIPARWR